MQSSQVIGSRPYITITLLACLIAGMLIGYDVQFSIYLIGFISLISFVVLSFIKPYWAFCGLILLGLTVWVSSIQLVEGISLMIGAGGVFLATWLLRLLMRNVTFVIIKEFWYLAGLAITILVSTLFNWGGPAGLAPVFTYIQLLLLTVLVVNFVVSPARLRQLGHVFIIASALMAGVILLDRWGLLSAGLVKSEAGGVLYAGSYQIFNRSGGIFGDPNFAALQLTIALPFIIEFWPGGSKRLRAWLFMVGLGILLAFSYTVSMSGLVGIASILLVKALLVRRRNFFIIIVQATLIGVVASWLVVHFLPSYYLDRIILNLEQLTLLFQTHERILFLQLGTTRGDTWSAAFKTFLHSPIIGNGPDNAIFINPLNSTLWYSRPYLAAHNVLLSIATDLGVMGLFFFLGLIFAAILAVHPFRTKATEKTVLQPSGDAIFTALLVCVMQGMALDLHTQKIMWVLIGMALVYKRISSPSAIIHGDK